MSDLQRIKPIFSEALDKKGPERESYLNEACGKDHDLKAEVEALLGAHEKAGDFLDSPLLDPGMPPDESPISEGPGTVIGRYKLLEKIGEGGMAVVYMAEQTEPIRRKIALKIIKLGMDTKSVIARFEAERQALAMMDHPNIAKVLDAGATETGRPYFVMELVIGVSITEYCDKNNLNTKERLALFIQVCSAVQHAHQKGIIHRDIKPTNVMVARHEGIPVPKVIDFGIAKAINQKLTEKTLFTRYAHIIGTPAYMSPEQAELSDLGIDTRTDVYSLGVLLYELLTSTTPFGEEELRKAGYIEMQRIIREQEPPKPSTKLSTLGDTLTDIAKYRASTPDSLTKTIRGDLDWIVMKSLEKNRARRYEEVSSFALDIERYLELRPISAHAPSASYRAQKFLRRNRLQAVTVLAILAVLGTIIVLSIWNQHQVRLAEAEGARQMNALSEARKLVKEGNLIAARQILVPILESKYVGLDARNLFVSKIGSEYEQDSRVKAIMDKHYRERVQYYTSLIQAEPKDPNNYQRRAQYYDYLRDRAKATADMRCWSVATSGKLSFDLQSAIHKKIRRILNSPFDYQFVFSAERPVNKIPLTNIAFGQKGRCNMNTFKIPMLSTHSLTISLFGLCLLTSLNSPVAYADFTFGQPVNLKTVIPVIDSASEFIVCLSYDALEMYIESNRPGGYGDWDLWVLKRASKDEDWGIPENLGPNINTSTTDSSASISSDGLTLYFTSKRNGGYGSNDLYMTTRLTRNDPWDPAVNMGPKINSSTADLCPWISADGLEFYFASYGRSGGYGGGDIYVAKRATINDPWDEAVNLGPVVNSPYQEHAVSLSPDGLLLLFADREDFRDAPRPGGYGGPDIWMTCRSSLSDPWQTPMNLGPIINGPEGEYVPRISPDGQTLYFCTDHPYENWQAQIIPIVDLTEDGIVNAADVCIMVDNWGKNEPLCDIGPMPWGDGIVDVQDLTVLAEHLFEEIPPAEPVE